MRVFLNSGGGQPYDPVVMGRIISVGFAGVRQGIPAGHRALLLCDDLVQYTGVRPLLLLGSEIMAMGEPPPSFEALGRSAARAVQITGLEGVTFEIGNEPDIATRYRYEPALFTEAVVRAAHAIWDVLPGARVVSGGVSNTNRRGLDYLRAAVRAGLPHVVIGFHSYRTHTTPDTPHDGFACRQDEMAELRRIAAGRPLWNTETGWHTAEQRLGWGRTLRWTDQQVADFVVQELAFLESEGVAVATVYQVTDGPTDTPFDRFGVWRVDGGEKPLARALRTFIQGESS